MKSILAVICTTALLATVAHADVFIYRGIYRIVDPDISVSNLLPKILNFYLVVDYDGAQYGDVIFGHIEGGKRYALSTASTYNFGQAPLPKSHTESFFFSGSASTVNPSSFSLNSLVFHGQDQKLLIRTKPANNTALRPHLLKGSGVSITRNGSSATFSEERTGLTFQGTATIKENNTSKSINEILNEFVAGLTDKGFTSL